MGNANLDLYLAREANKYETSDLYDLYASISNKNLRRILAGLHSQLNYWFRIINSDLRISYDEEGNKVSSGGYFHAQDSRNLLKVFCDLNDLKEKLHMTQYEFELVNTNYDNTIRRCKRFLVPRKGSQIPGDFQTIKIEDIEPIFAIKNNISITTSTQTVYAKLDPAGEGSYAHVFVYEDPTYHIKIALKRAKPELDGKELERFRQEFTVLKSLNSLYIVQVYAYDEERKEYTMEYMDKSIYKYIQRCNAILSLNDRKKAIFQICRGLMCMHKMNILHRDISLTNAYVKHYKDADIFKIGDFGLIKMPESCLTSLINVGYANYSMYHETYALTRLCFYILTGRTNVTKQKDGMIKQF